jgi:adenylate cyclase
MMNQVVLLTVAAGRIAGAIWRARQHLERAVHAEAQSSNLGRYFSGAVAARLAEDVSALDVGRVQDAAVLFHGYCRLDPHHRDFAA